MGLCFFDSTVTTCRLVNRHLRTGGEGMVCQTRPRPKLRFFLNLFSSYVSERGCMYICNSRYAPKAFHVQVRLIFYVFLFNSNEKNPKQKFRMLKPGCANTLHKRWPLNLYYSVKNLICPNFHNQLLWWSCQTRKSRWYIIFWVRLRLAERSLDHF